MSVRAGLPRQGSCSFRSRSGCVARRRSVPIRRRSSQVGGLIVAAVSAEYQGGACRTAAFEAIGIPETRPTPIGFASSVSPTARRHPLGGAQATARIAPRGPVWTLRIRSHSARIGLPFQEPGETRPPGYDSVVKLARNTGPPGLTGHALTPRERSANPAPSRPASWSGLGRLPRGQCHGTWASFPRSGLLDRGLDFKKRPLDDGTDQACGVQVSQ